MNGYESVENRWLKPGSLPPVAFMGTSGKWGFHGYEFDVLQCHKPPIGDGLLVKLGMLYDWHPIIARLDRARCFSSAYPFVRSDRERKKVFFFDFSRFLRGKGINKKEKKKKTIFRPRRERKKTIFRPGTERKKEKKTIFPVFRGEKVCRNKKNTRAFGQRKKKRKKIDFSRFSRGKGMQKQKKHACVWAEKEKKIDFSRFSRGKGMQKQKKHACVRAEKEKQFVFSIFPVFRGERYAEKKVQHMRSGRERKKETFSIFPVFRGEKVCRND